MRPSRQGGSVPFATPQAAAPSITITLIGNHVIVTSIGLPAGTLVVLMAFGTPPMQTGDQINIPQATPYTITVNSDDDGPWQAAATDVTGNTIAPWSNVINIAL